MGGGGGEGAKGPGPDPFGSARAWGVGRGRAETRQVPKLWFVCFLEDLKLWIMGFCFFGTLDYWIIGLLSIHCNPKSNKPKIQSSKKPKKTKFGTLFVMEYTFTTNFHIWALGPPRAPGPTLLPQSSKLPKNNNPKFQKTNKPKFQKTKKPNFGNLGLCVSICRQPELPKLFFVFWRIWDFGLLFLLVFSIFGFEAHAHVSI